MEYYTSFSLGKINKTFLLPEIIAFSHIKLDCFEFLHCLNKASRFFMIRKWTYLNKLIQQGVKINIDLYDISDKAFLRYSKYEGNELNIKANFIYDVY